MTVARARMLSMFHRTASRGSPSVNRRALRPVYRLPLRVRHAQQRRLSGESVCASCQQANPTMYTTTTGCFGEVRIVRLVGLSALHGNSPSSFWVRVYCSEHPCCCCWLEHKFVAIAISFVPITHDATTETEELPISVLNTSEVLINVLANRHR